MAKSWLQKYGTYEEEVVASAVGIVAFAGGGQANATQLLKKFNSVDTVASANDSVKLVPALIGKVQGVFNNTANSLTVYPSTGEYIDGTVNNGYVISPGDYVEFRAYASGRWDSYAGAASGTGTVTSVSVVTANGFGGTVATPNTTPAITIRTTVTGILVGNGTAVSAAVAGDFPTLNQSTTGNAATATALQTARTINGVAFDGTANIVIPAGSGTVTSVSVVTANGFSGSVATDTTTPAITITTSITGMLKGNGTATSAATAGVDYSNGTSALATGILKSTTGTGALSIAVAGDFPTLNQNTTGTASNVTGVVAIANGGTGQATATLGFNALSPLTTRGDIIIRGVTNNERLSLGASGTILRSNGTDLAYTTATYPTTLGVGQVIHATAANVIGGTTDFVRLTTGELLLGKTAISVTGEIAGFKKDIAGSTLIVVENLSSTGQAAYRVISDQRLFGFGVYGSAFAAYGAIASNDGYIYGNTNLAIAADAGTGVIKFATGTGASEKMRLDTSGRLGIGITSVTAFLHLKAGTATANTAPLKLTAGTNLSTPENGAFEFDGTNLYFTTGGTRKTVTIV